MKPKAILNFGPAGKSQMCVELYYTPTPEQIKNIKEMFGWEVEMAEIATPFIEED